MNLLSRMFREKICALTYLSKLIINTSDFVIKDSKFLNKIFNEELNRSRDYLHCFEKRKEILLTIQSCADSDMSTLL